MKYTTWIITVLLALTACQGKPIWGLNDPRPPIKTIAVAKNNIPRTPTPVLTIPRGAQQIPSNFPNLAQAPRAQQQIPSNFPIMQRTAPALTLARPRLTAPPPPPIGAIPAPSIPPLASRATPAVNYVPRTRYIPPPPPPPLSLGNTAAISNATPALTIEKAGTYKPWAPPLSPSAWPQDNDASYYYYF